MHLQTKGGILWIQGQLLDMLLVVQQGLAIIVVNLLYSYYTCFFTVNSTDVVVTP